MKEALARKLAAAGIAIVGVLLVVGIVVFGLDRNAATSKDFLQYWSAEQLLAHGANPYDLSATLQLAAVISVVDKWGPCTRTQELEYSRRGV